MITTSLSWVQILAPQHIPWTRYCVTLLEAERQTAAAATQLGHHNDGHNALHLGVKVIRSYTL